MASGTATLDFGAAPGKSEASVDVTGLSGLSAASFIEAFVMAEASANRTADENRIDPPMLVAEYLTAASMRIHGQVRDGLIIGQVPVRWGTL